MLIHVGCARGLLRSFCRVRDIRTQVVLVGASRMMQSLPSRAWDLQSRGAGIRLVNSEFGDTCFQIHSLLAPTVNCLLSPFFSLLLVY